MTISAEEEARYAELQVQALDAARRNETELLGAMLQAGMPVNLADEKGNTLLMLAAYNGNLEAVQLCLTHGAEVDRRNARGQTPLGGVAFKGYVEIAKLLLDAGADIHADNGNGATAYNLAVMFGRTEMAEMLKARGATRGQSRLRAAAYRALGVVVRPLVKRALARKKQG